MYNNTSALDGTGVKINQLFENLYIWIMWLKKAIG